MGDNLRGAWVALVNFFDSSLSLDEEALRRHLEHMEKNDFTGFVVHGSTGEPFSLQTDERLKILDKVKESALRSQKKVMVGITHNNTRTAIEWATQAEEHGADVVMSASPFYNKPNIDGILWHFESIIESIDIPLVLYHAPSRVGVSWSFNTIIQLLSHPQIIGIKEASSDYKLWLSLLTHPVFKDKIYYAGDDDTIAPLLSFGAHGFISASANLIPEKMIELYTCYIRKDYEKLFNKQKEILPLVSKIFSETNPVALKYLLYKLKGFPYHVRSPLMDLGEKLRLDIDRFLDSPLSYTSMGKAGGASFCFDEDDTQQQYGPRDSA